ncbi:polyphosphate kinase [Pedobacter antarcticus 4BY]|uniref:Polyphosphate kinase n=2 Tax=Pedobacter antarcticus TaxID=34086 RepID=A0A081PIZ7_9SPHI|nr:polyphosphate kinase 1 [Pedobacter antarcticus]KEQ30670.1 polyphosphate kinase [Pedobacter antarcticus 4BY]SFF20244.1 polyphosphate kinase [Pedobacter antarcticus]
MNSYTFFNRDLSWLTFNERVLMEAENTEIPLMERIRFLSIYSSNLDEFYRVRMPVLMSVDVNDDRQGMHNTYTNAQYVINVQQERFGRLLQNQIIPALAARHITLIYKQEIPEEIKQAVSDVFFNNILGYLRLYQVDRQSFFAENNKLYQAVVLENKAGKEQMEFIAIPSSQLPRFYSFNTETQQFIVFLEDIICTHSAYLFPDQKITGIYQVKITRDAELHLDEGIDEENIVQFEHLLKQRDLGPATRFLIQPEIPLRYIYTMASMLKLNRAAIIQGGFYHHLRDLDSIPVKQEMFSYPKLSPVRAVFLRPSETLFDLINQKDQLVNVPYQQYDPILRFFNEAAHDSFTEEIYVTLYRVAAQSRIVTALITAAQNGKKVTVMVELKARFDEANNLKWATEMKAAGVRILYSNAALKVHAKVALVRRRINGEQQYLGLLATGNLNESTAKFYTDHVLMTARQPMLIELQQLFGYLRKKKKRPALEDQITFSKLLVAGFNLLPGFITLIDREIAHAQAGREASLIIKMNNLEERVLISKLYEASQAGVKIQLIIRSICCLIPGIKGQSENITVTRIVGRYLEHGRLFLFQDAGRQELFMGSSDWMNRNIYSRIEVCFPVEDPDLKAELITLLNLQLKDNVQAVRLNARMEQIRVDGNGQHHSQEEIYQFLKTGST